MLIENTPKSCCSWLLLDVWIFLHFSPKIHKNWSLGRKKRKSTCHKKITKVISPRVIPGDINCSFSAPSINKYYRFSISGRYELLIHKISQALCFKQFTLLLREDVQLCVMKRLPHRCNHLLEEFFIFALQTPPVMRVGAQRVHLYWASLTVSTTNTKNIAYLVL